MSDKVRPDIDPDREIPKKKLSEYEILFNAEHYAELRAKADADNVKVIHVRRANLMSEFDKLGGCTAAVGRQHNHGRYAQMAVSICSHNMTFNKKLGGYLALKAYYENKVIPIFLGSRTPSGVATVMLESMLDV